MTAGDDFHLRWASITAPLRPPPEAVAAIRAHLPQTTGLALQLGVTPELAALTQNCIAADRSEAMVKLAWPSNTAARQAIIADWLELPLADASIATAYGDGCLTTLAWPDQYRLFFSSIARVLRPGARLVLRCFAGPAHPESIEALCAAAFAGQIKSFSAFKLRLNMASYVLAGSAPHTSTKIHQLFESRFASRQSLAAAAAWTLSEIAGIDAYRGGVSLHSYPTRAEIAATLPPVLTYQFIETSDYEMAECCPLLLVDATAVSGTSQNSEVGPK